MTNSLRIGLMTPAWPGHNTPNGIATAVFHLATGLHNIGHTPVILSGKADGAQPEGIPFLEYSDKPLNLIEKIKSNLGQAESIHRQHQIKTLAECVRGAVDTHGLDIIIMEETWGWASDLIPLVSVPVVVYLHGPWLLHKHVQSYGSVESDQHRDELEQKTFRTAAGLLAPVPHILDAVVSANDLGDKPRQVIANSYWSPPIKPDHEDGSVLFVGRYDRHKGGDTVLAAFDQLIQTHPGSQLSFAGPDRGLRHPDGHVTSLDEALTTLTPEARARIAYLGQQSGPQITALRRNHPIALIASRYEVFGYTMLEAMAAGQAIVSTEVGGPAELLKHGVTALLVPPDDPAAMAEALRKIMDDPLLAQRLGQAARAEVEKTFFPDTIAAEIVEFCHKVLARPTQL